MSAKADRKSTRLNSSHLVISYAVFCLKKKKNNNVHLLRDGDTACSSRQCALPAWARSVLRVVCPAKFGRVLSWWCFLFFFNDTATTEIYTLSLHDALPICGDWERKRFPGGCQELQ